MNGTSKKFQLDKNDLQTIFVRALLVALAAFLTYFGEKLTELDKGPESILWVPIVAVIITTVVRWLKDYTKEEKKDGVSTDV